MSVHSMPTARPVTPIGIVADELSQLLAEFERLQIFGENPQLIDRLRRTTAIAAGLESYVDRCTSQPSDSLQHLALRTMQHAWDKSFDTGETSLPLEQEMLSGHAEGELLKLLISISGARSALEIGMFTGYASAAMAEALPADGRVVAIEYDEFVARFAQESFAQFDSGGKIEVHVGAANDVLLELAKAKERFDFVFIDADKTGYRDYLETLLEGPLLTRDALICVDNTLLQGQPYTQPDQTENGQAIADFNRFVATRDDLQHVMIPLRDGVTLIRRTQATG